MPPEGADQGPREPGIRKGPPSATPPNHLRMWGSGRPWSAGGYQKGGEGGGGLCGPRDPSAYGGQLQAAWAPLDCRKNVRATRREGRVLGGYPPLPLLLRCMASLILRGGSGQRKTLGSTRRR